MINSIEKKNKDFYDVSNRSLQLFGRIDDDFLIFSSYLILAVLLFDF